MAEKRLRAVKAGEKPPAPVSISDAVASGSARDVLASMRRALARKLDDGEISSNAIASSYKELRELDRLIRVADAERETQEAQENDRSDRRRRSFSATAL